MGVIYARINKELEIQFRVNVAKKFGGKRGAISKGIEEAIELWLKENRED